MFPGHVGGPGLDISNLSVRNFGFDFTRQGLNSGLGRKARHRKIAALAALLVGVSQGALAAGLPEGASIAHGDATISQSGSSLMVVQSTPKLITNWNSFSIAPGSSVTFVQPSSQAVALNRVTGADPSVVAGALNANGRVFLLNPNGILFAQGARVSAGGLLASTLSLSDGDFLNGDYHFTGQSRAAIVMRAR
jgi:filamentous hemagglutinin family protein